MFSTRQLVCSLFVGFGGAMLRDYLSYTTNPDPMVLTVLLVIIGIVALLGAFR